MTKEAKYLSEKIDVLKYKRNVLNNNEGKFTTDNEISFHKRSIIELEEEVKMLNNILDKLEGKLKFCYKCGQNK
jgi:hypothetical protein